MQVRTTADSKEAKNLNHNMYFKETPQYVFQRN